MRLVKAGGAPAILDCRLDGRSGMFGKLRSVLVKMVWIWPFEMIKKTAGCLKPEVNMRPMNFTNLFGVEGLSLRLKKIWEIWESICKLSERLLKHLSMWIARTRLHSHEKFNWQPKEMHTNKFRESLKRMQENDIAKQLFCECNSRHNTSVLYLLQRHRQKKER